MRFLAVPVDADLNPRETTRVDVVLEQGVDPREALGGEADRLRRRTRHLGGERRDG